MSRFCYPLFLALQCVSQVALADLCSRPDLPLNYKKDCKLKTDFQAVESCFKHRNKNIDHVQVYRALRLIDRKDYSKKRQGQVWDIYEPAPKTWVFWEQANFFRKKLQSELETSAQRELTIEDLERLHTKTVDSELLGWNKYQTTLGLKPSIGSIRKSGHTASGFSDLLDGEDAERLMKDPLVTQKILKVNRRGPEVAISYTDSAQVEGELKKLVKEINEKVKLYRNLDRVAQKDLPAESPLEFAMRVQRTYVAIHPFHEGSGRTSRLLQELVLGLLGLPYVPSGDLQRDAVMYQDKYNDQAHTALEQMITKLNECCKEVSSDSNPDCRSIYEEGSEEGSGMAGEIQKVTISQCTHEQGVVQDVISKLKTFPDLLGSNPCGPAPLKISFKNDTEKYAFYKRLFESMATPALGEGDFKDKKWTAYTWVNSKEARVARETVYNSAAFNVSVKGKSDELKPPAASLRGFGLYASRNPHDSSDYSIDDAHLDHPESLSPYLYKVELDGNVPVVHVNHPSVKEALESVGFDYRKDFHRMSPDVVIDYADHTAENDWINIMLPQSTLPYRRPFKVSRASAKDLSVGDIETILNHYYKKIDRGNPIGEDQRGRPTFGPDKRTRYQIPLVRDWLMPELEKKKSLAGERLEQLNARGLSKNRHSSSLDQLVDYLDRGGQLKDPDFRMVLGNQHFWTAENTCVHREDRSDDIDTGDRASPLTQISMDADQILDQETNLCQKMEFWEKTQLQKFLRKAREMLVTDQRIKFFSMSHPGVKVDFNQEKRKDLIRSLETIIDQGQPFVTSTKKCAVLNQADGLEYVDKKLCADRDPSYKAFLQAFSF